MRKLFPLTLAAVLLLSTVFFASPAPAVTAKGAPNILEFGTMIGVPRPYTGGTNPIRNVPGGGLPWVIADARGELKSNGELEIKVTGLVLDPTDPVVISRGLGGTNPSPNFIAIVSCLSKDSTGAATIANVSTGLFPADAQGNAEIEATVSLPQPCIAPIIFVANPGGAWFASTGF